MDLVRCARGVDVGYKEDSTSTTSTSTCIHRYPTFLPFGSSRSDGNRWMLKVYFLPSVEPSTPSLNYGWIRCTGNRGNRGKKDKEDRTPVTQTPLPLWSFVWSGLRVLSTGDVTSYSISYSRGNIPCLQPKDKCLDNEERRKGDRGTRSKKERSLGNPP